MGTRRAILREARSQGYDAAWTEYHTSIPVRNPHDDLGMYAAWDAGYDAGRRDVQASALRQYGDQWK